MFGGSFDPVHNGHVQLAQAFIKELSLDKVFIVPAFISPFKQGGAAVLPHHRAEMCRLAFRDIQQAEISDIEIKREGSSYTYQTLQALTELHPISFSKKATISYSLTAIPNAWLSLTILV